MDRALKDGVAGGPHVQHVFPALRHGAHWPKVLWDLRVGVEAEECRTHAGKGWGEDQLGRGGSIWSPGGMGGGPLTFPGASPLPHLHLLQLAVVGTPEDHPTITAPSGHQRPVPQGAEPKHTTVVGSQHRLCDAVPTCGAEEGWPGAGISMERLAPY